MRRIGGRIDRLMGSSLHLKRQVPKLSTRKKGQLETRLKGRVDVDFQDRKTENTHLQATGVFLGLGHPLQGC